MTHEMVESGRWALRDPSTGRLALIAGHRWPSPVIGMWTSSDLARQAGIDLGLQGQPEDLDLSVLLREVIEHGVGGIMDATSGAGWQAATRLTEVNHDRPTALVATDPGATSGSGLVPVLRRTGLSESPSSDFIPWERWDILDKAWLPFVGEDPWLGYQAGQQFWTVMAGDSPIMIQGDETLGPWFSPDGTLILATSPEALRTFINHQYRGQIRAFDDFGESLETQPVEDLHGWLQSFTAPFSGVINPGMPRGMSAVIPAGSTLVIGVSGEFQILPSNDIVRKEPPRWQGYATFHYPGGPDRDLLPLERSFADNPLGIHSQALKGLSDDETREVLQEITRVAPPELDPWLIEPDLLYLEDPVAVEAWDTAFGERYLQTHANLVDLVAWLKDYERESDRTARTSGFRFSYWDVGVQGSGDPVAEELRGSLTVRALDQWLETIVRHGYRPSDADRLTKIVNSLFATLHISVVGFLSDLTWRLQAQEDSFEGFFFTESPIQEERARQWLSAQAQPRVDPTTSVEAARRVSERVWRVLKPHTQVFITTGLTDFESRGLSPLLDYAPVNLSLVKALETELNATLDTFASTATVGTADDHELAENDRILLALVHQGRHPTLGQTRHLLSSPDGPLQGQLHAHLRGIGAGNLLTSKYREGLYKTVSRYRNGGVHEETVTLDDCRRCLDHLLDGDGKRVGLISQTVAWKTI